jgi:membrane-associated phospholipid phosphatase
MQPYLRKRSGSFGVVEPACARSKRLNLARALSIVGHPFVFAPCAALLAMMAGPAGGRLAAQGGLILALLVLGIGVYSWLQVRSGRWQHVDASLPQERRSLNRVAFALMLLAALVAFTSDTLRPAGVGFALAAGLIALGWIGLPRFKLSLHVAFAAFGALLLWPRGVWAVALGLVFSVAIAWSRLMLQRHTAGEVWGGAVAGTLAGVVLWAALSAFYGISK